jgi:CRISPR/Cas system CSM-associated protein Csm4 (group 5 of RAMP superfamily)
MHVISAEDMIDSLKLKLQYATQMPAVPYMINNQMDLKELDEIHPETWKNISYLIQDAVTIFIQKLGDTRWSIEPVREYAINSNKFLLSNMIGMHNYFGEKISENNNSQNDKI